MVWCRVCVGLAGWLQRRTFAHEERVGVGSFVYSWMGAGWHGWLHDGPDLHLCAAKTAHVPSTHGRKLPAAFLARLGAAVGAVTQMPLRSRARQKKLVSHPSCACSLQRANRDACCNLTPAANWPVRPRNRVGSILDVAPSLRRTRRPVPGCGRTDRPVDSQPAWPCACCACLLASIREQAW
ncbi:hypothetical protein CC78DRAFT_593973 [Lojkania enalia]|uniref:Uncharacterized protein n=1 Tax=Lojkania enalia TaxID=147567 RepID=A0A9P4K122_9PLEO|nr:hypothetical protein CC78DRAFT_593973 [Didymosphaeria enalia]